MEEIMIPKAILSILISIIMPLKAMQESGIELSISPSKLSFDVQGHQFLIEFGNQASISDFVRNIVNVSNSRLSEIGNQISGLVNNPENKKFALLHQLVNIYAAYEEAGDQHNYEAKDKIRELVKPILRKYPDKEAASFKNYLHIFELQENELNL